ncbi:MAG: FCSD flavin-binding domain-containing protein, partial [Halorhodospira sp.]
NPYRCPPGPYERASLVAHYLKLHKPSSKILILDNKDAFSKQELFEEGWAELYGDMIEWVPAAEGGRLDHVSVKDRKVFTEAGFQEHQGDVINLIPPQKAGAIAQRAELTDSSGWCPVDQQDFRSTRHDDVFVVGDAAIAGDMPKSGHSANNQAKRVAATIVTELSGGSVPDYPMVNTCYSLIGPEWGVTVAAVYEYQDGAMRSVEGAGGLSPEDAPRSVRAREASYAPGWYASITQDIFGSAEEGRG